MNDLEQHKQEILNQIREVEEDLHRMRNEQQSELNDALIKFYTDIKLCNGLMIE